MTNPNLFLCLKSTEFIGCLRVYNLTDILVAWLQLMQWWFIQYYTNIINMTRYTSLWITVKHIVPFIRGVHYRIWYHDWGNCGVTNDLRSTPQPEGGHCGVTNDLGSSPQWPKSRYQFLFYHDASKHIKSMQIRVCISRKSLIKMLQISHYEQTAE